MFDILEIIPRPDLIKIIDVGAMSLGSGAAERYTPLVKAGIARVVGFEPVQAECDKLNAQADASHQFLPYAVGDGTTRTFHLCNRAMTSSLYEPNTKLLDRFQNLANLTEVVDRSPIQTHRLDDLPEAAEPDYLKLDVQGAELDVLRGAAIALRHVTILECEVEFVPMYIDQPLFADVDAELRRHGFLFHKFPTYAGRAFKPVILNNDVNRPVSQWLWADAVYVKSFMDFEEMSPSSLLKLAVVLHTVYSSVDLVALALKHYDLQAGTQLQPAYLQRLFSRPSH